MPRSFVHHLLALTVATSGLVVGLATAAEAASFNFSYEFSDSSVFSGTIQGDLDADGNTLSNISGFVGSWSSSSILTNIDFFSSPETQVSGVFKLDGQWGNDEFSISTGEYNTVDGQANDFLASLSFSQSQASTYVFSYNCLNLGANNTCTARNGDSFLWQADSPYNANNFLATETIVELPELPEEPGEEDMETPIIESPVVLDPPVVINPPLTPGAQPVPEPMTILGSLVAGGFGMAWKRKRQAKANNA